MDRRVDTYTKRIWLLDCVRLFLTFTRRQWRGLRVIICIVLQMKPKKRHATCTKIINIKNIN